MFDSEVRWLLGILIAGAASVGGIIMRDRHVLKSISEGDEKLHVRINTFEKSFVRRADLNGHMQTIENMVNQMREEQRETNQRIDRVLQLMIKNSKE